MAAAAPAFNSLADALKDAGIESKLDKLKRLMAQAISADAPGRGIAGPSLERFQVLLMRQDDAAELLWEMFADVRFEVLAALFREVLPGVRAGKKFGGQKNDATHAGLAPEGDAAAETEGELEPGNPLSRPAAVVPITDGKRESHRPPGDGISGMFTIMKWQQDSWIRRITVGNRPIASMRRGELDLALSTTELNGRFMSLIRDRWPPHADNETVEFWLTDEDGDKLYRQAKEMAA